MKIKELLDVFKKEDIDLVPAKGYSNFKGMPKVDNLQEAEITKYRVFYEKDKVRLEIYFDENSN